MSEVKKWSTGGQSLYLLDGSPTDDGFITEITERSWEDQPSSFRFVSYCASQNPLGALGYGFQRAAVAIEEVCQNCQRKLAAAIAHALADLAPKEKGG